MNQTETDALRKALGKFARWSTTEEHTHEGDARDTLEDIIKLCPQSDWIGVRGMIEQAFKKPSGTWIK